MNNKKTKVSQFMLVAMLSLCLSGCSHFPGAYTLPIEQGNDIGKEQVDKLRVGMNEEQVRFLLGTPMLKDAFNKSRWDYVYYATEKRKLKEKHHLVVYFEDGRVTDFQGDMIAA